jgi:putative membrane protein insertion efficiency factor
MKRILIGLIEYYQQILSPYLFRSCLFIPSCSEYTKQAILKYGCLWGIIRGLRRIILCQGFMFKFGEELLD